MQINLLLAAIILLTSLLLISFTNAKNTDVKSVKIVNDSSISGVSEEASVIAEEANLADVLYSRLNLKKLGLSQDQRLDAAGKVRNPYLTIIDMGQSSRKKRLYIIDMENQKLVRNTFVSHGKNSGLDMAN